MKTKHIFVAALDVGELLPFTIGKFRKVSDSMKELDRARKELIKFVDLLEKQYKEYIFYMGMDVIEAKTYERFIFSKNGFFEIMTESPVAMVAHFTDEKEAKRFCEALQKTLRVMLKRDQVSEMFIDSIKVQSECDQSLTYEKWDMMKGLKGK